MIFSAVAIGTLTAPHNTSTFAGLPPLQPPPLLVSAMLPPLLSDVAASIVVTATVKLPATGTTVAPRLHARFSGFPCSANI